MESLQDEDSYGMGIMALSALAGDNVDDVIPHDDVICESMKTFPSMSYYALTILVALSMKGKVTSQSLLNAIM